MHVNFPEVAYGKIEEEILYLKDKQLRVPTLNILKCRVALKRVPFSVFSQKTPFGIYCF